MSDDIKKEIEKIIKNNPVVLFMKGTKDFPQCGFSSVIANLLQYEGVNFKDVNVLESDDWRSSIKEYSNWPTIPQLYINGDFIGGCDIVREMYDSGELMPLLKNFKE